MAISLFRCRSLLSCPVFPGYFCPCSGSTAALSPISVRLKKKRQKKTQQKKQKNNPKQLHEIKEKKKSPPCTKISSKQIGKKQKIGQYAARQATDRSGDRKPAASLRSTAKKSLCGHTLSSGAERREVRAASTVRASLFLGSCTNLIACALCETWKSAFSSHPLHQSPSFGSLLRWGQRQLSSRGKDQSSGEAADPAPAAPGLAEHVGQLEDGALLDDPGTHTSLKAPTWAPTCGARGWGWRKAQGVTPQPRSFLLLPIRHARGLKESSMLCTSMPASTGHVRKHHRLDLD